MYKKWTKVDSCFSFNSMPFQYAQLYSPGYSSTFYSRFLPFWGATARSSLKWWYTNTRLKVFSFHYISQFTWARQISSSYTKIWFWYHNSDTGDIYKSSEKRLTESSILFISQFKGNIAAGGGFMTQAEIIFCFQHQECVNYKSCSFRNVDKIYQPDCRYWIWCKVTTTEKWYMERLVIFFFFFRNVTFSLESTWE